VLQVLSQLMQQNSCNLIPVLQTVGLIGYPEGMDCIEGVVRCLEHKDPEVRAMASWTVGKLGRKASQKAASK